MKTVTLNVQDLNDPPSPAEGRHVYMAGFDDLNMYVVVDEITKGDTNVGQHSVKEARERVHD